MNRWILPGLVLAAAGQLAVLGNVPGLGTSRWVVPGDEISDIQVTDGSDAPMSLATGQPTLVLVFHSECAHCLRVAPEWRRWLDQHRDELSVLAISSEGFETAWSYSSQHEWDIGVGSVKDTSMGTRGHALTSRTPWVFVLDGEGVVVAGGHGGMIEELGDTVLELSELELPTQ